VNSFFVAYSWKGRNMTQLLQKAQTPMFNQASPTEAIRALLFQRACSCTLLFCMAGHEPKRNSVMTELLSAIGTLAIIVLAAVAITAV
jgi:hypothetical protein